MFYIFMFVVGVFMTSFVHTLLWGVIAPVALMALLAYLLAYADREE